jgi:outer membrane protein OmpA-like peptidoglycan-associated protein
MHGCARRSGERGVDWLGRRVALPALLATMALAAVLALPAHADVQSARAEWSALQGRESAFFAPRHHRDAEMAMAALEAAAAAGPPPEATLAAAERKLEALDGILDKIQSTWSDLLQLRREAREAGAAQAAPRDWTSAENTLFAASQKLETGRVDPAKRQAAEAKPLYVNARYAGWRAGMLGGADSILARLDAQKARVYVPRSWVRAVDARTAAERTLSQHGKPDDATRAAGDRAAYEARHARHLFDRIRAACEQKAPDQLESAILDWEASVTRTAASLGVTARFDTGFSPALAAIEAAVPGSPDHPVTRPVAANAGGAGTDSLAAQLRVLQEQLRDRDVQIAELQSMQAEQETTLRIQAAFRRDEARVLLDGRDVVVRLQGPTFDGATSKLLPDAEPVLDKVAAVVAQIPGAQIVVEGHADVPGQPEIDQELSQQRAQAVRDYLQRKTGVEASRISAIGHGATRPLASNETEAGRALNQRIEIIVARPQ